MTTPDSMATSPDPPGAAEFYRFTAPPFSLAADPRTFVETEAQRPVLDSLRQSLPGKRPLTIVTGPHGIGKTMICGALVERLGARTFWSYLAVPVTSFAALLQTMLVDFGVASADAAIEGRLARHTAHRLLGVLHDFLLSLPAVGATAVLIVDEAHHMSGELLEEIRVLSNLEAQDVPLLSIVLVGRPDLLDRCGGGEAVALDPRVSCPIAVPPLTRRDIGGYIAQRLAMAQPQSPVAFHRRAIDAVHALSDGAPRTVNQLCQRALAAGAQQRSLVISAEAVERAAAMLALRDASNDAGRWSWRRLVASGIAR